MPSFPISEQGVSPQFGDQPMKIQTSHLSSCIASFGLPASAADKDGMLTAQATLPSYGIEEALSRIDGSAGIAGTQLWMRNWAKGWENPWQTQQMQYDAMPAMTTPKSSAAKNKSRRVTEQTSQNKPLSLEGAGSPPKKEFHKTVLCTFFPKGLCKKGANCSFAHGGTELQPTPDLTKTSLCHSWKKGSCLYSSEECPFAHGKQELRTSVGKAALPKQSQNLMSATRAARNPRVGHSSMKPNMSLLGEEMGMLSLDEQLLIKLEARESKESGFDAWNDETFGGGQVNNWTYTQMLPDRQQVPPPPFPPPPPPACLRSDIVAPPPGLRVPSATMSTISGSGADLSDSESQGSAAYSSEPHQ